MALSYRKRIRDFFLIHIILAGVCNQAAADRTSLKIYQTLQADHFCFRRLNGTHEIGCSSDRTGNVGVVHLVSTEADIQTIVANPDGTQYVAVLPVEFFNMGNMSILQDSKRVTGVIVLRRDNTLPSSGFSPDQTCPNQNFDLYAEDKEYSSCKKATWNPFNPATDMFFMRWDFPIFLLNNETSIDIIVEKCFKEHNLPKGDSKPKWPLCAAQLKTRMNAAKDSVTCIRRSGIMGSLTPVRYCDPLTDRNIYSTLYPTYNNKTVDARSIIVVGARIDTFSLFDNLAPGADSSVTGMVTLLVAAQMLKQLRDAHPADTPKKNVLFLIFNGEAFDYIGSSRVAYDMEKGDFPVRPNSGVLLPAALKMAHISHFLELSQVAPLGGTPTVYLHTDPITTKTTTVNDTANRLIMELEKAASEDWLKVSVQASPNDQPLPPSSVQQFLKKDKQIAAVVVSNHNKQFENRYYNSFFDTWENLNDTNEGIQKTAGHLTKVAAMVALAVFKEVTGRNAPEIQLQDFRVTELLECYLLNSSCSLFEEVRSQPSGQTMARSYPLYVGVDPNGGNVNPSTTATRLLMAYLTGTHLENATKDDCSEAAKKDKPYHYDWMHGTENQSGICVKSITMLTMARSPAFEIGDVGSTEYSTWTESVWDEISLQIFLMPSWQQEAATLSAGIAVFLVSLGVVFCLNKEAALLFTPRALVGI
ncbi:unnamed protein product [Ixodes pacificus]